MSLVSNIKIERAKALLDEFSLDTIRSIKLLRDITENYDLNQKISRLAQLDLNTPLSSKLQEIINSDTKSKFKQVAIEKLVREHDEIGLVDEINNSVNVRAVILHDLYKNIAKSLKSIVSKYTRRQRREGIKI